VIIDDSLLPAATYLTGAHAVDVLAPVIAASGGELVSCEASQVQYRPQSDLVVRYRCRVGVAGEVTTDTVLAATTLGGPPSGTVPVVAVTPDGQTLEVGVWRWPFDPVLTDLAEMVTPHLASRHLAALVGGAPSLEVVAYRPTERAVVRVRGPEREIYVKVVPAVATPALIGRHTALASVGLPVPRVLAHGDGWIAMEALHGTTLRDRLKSGSGALPSPDRYRELLDALASVHVPDASPVRSRIGDAPHHARMLATVLPSEASRVDELIDRLTATASERHPAGTVHGDFHEAQLVVDDHVVTGLLDIDDVGPGDPLDDVGALVAHLRFRAMSAAVTGEPGSAGRPDAIEAYAGAVRNAVCHRYDPADVDRHAAAVLVGLATGPFRIQHADWEDLTRRTIELAESHLVATSSR
jgi:aminoglycoside phosphotransferase (APT) family kinase protein